MRHQYQNLSACLAPVLLIASSAACLGGGYAWAAISSGAPLHVRGLAGAAGTTLFLSSAIAPPYDFSTNLVPECLIHLKKREDVSGSFLLRITRPQ